MTRHLLLLNVACSCVFGVWQLLAGAEQGQDPVSSAAATASERASSAIPTAAARPAAELRLPEGFEATIYAGDDLVHDAYCLTTDERDRVAVSAPGYIRILTQSAQSDRADHAVTFADGPKSGAQGLCFDGTDLLAVGDGGLLRYRDANGDLHADGPPRLLLKLKSGGEHHAHAIRRGPDGWWYFICGNDTGITAAEITAASSPVAQPSAGALLRFRFDEASGNVRDVSVIADGMRNAYDFDFTAIGDAVTYDSDDEREVSLPWYRPTRVFRLTPGSNAGWMSRSWKRPDQFPEMPEVLARLGRGSPTGVVVYRHAQFPTTFLNAVFVCDWTFGRVIAIPLDENDRPGKPIEFLRAAGTAGFAPTDIAVDSRGDMFVSAGGRGTTGAVYRIRYVGDGSAAASATASGQGGRTDHETSLVFDAADLPEALRDESPTVRRLALQNAAERFARMSASDRLTAAVSSDIARLLEDLDPNVRKAAMHVVSQLSDRDQASIAGHVEQPTQSVRFQLGRLRRNETVNLEGLRIAASVLELPSIAADLRFDAVRLAQLSLGDVGPTAKTPDTFSGYVARADLNAEQPRIEPLRSRLAALFPTGDETADEEFVRLTAMLQPSDSQIIGKLLDRVDDDSHPTSDLHHLFAIARLPGKRSSEQTSATASALLAIDAKLAARHLSLDSNWGERLGDLGAALAAVDPTLPMALTHSSQFGRPGHVVLLKAFPTKEREAAAVAILRKAEAQLDYQWTPEVVSLIGESRSEESMTRLREFFDEPALRGAALTALSREPMPVDRAKFVAGLDDPSVDVVERCVAALEALGASDDPRELAALVLALRRLDRDAREYAARNRIAKLLHQRTGELFGFIPGKEGFKPQRESISRWVEFLRDVAPDAVPAPGGDWNETQKKLSASEGLAGDARRGKRLFEEKSCGRCHDGGAVGPDLAGVTGRFSRDDLFLTIADPDRDVSPRYRGTLIQTRDGKIVTGLVVYESVDGVTLKDGEKTWRVEAEQIEFRKPLETSLMPRGLLKDATPQNLSDLAAYLATIGKE